MQEMFIEQPADFAALATRLLDEMEGKDHAHVLALHGELGAGKTTFTQSLARVLGVQELVTSPTFVIMRQYPVVHPKFSQLVHIDAYRIESDAELAPLHFDELLRDPHNLICIEWAGKIEAALPPDALHVTVTVAEGGVRKVVYGDVPEVQ